MTSKALILSGKLALDRGLSCVPSRTHVIIKSILDCLPHVSTETVAKITIIIQTS